MCVECPQTSRRALLTAAAAVSLVGTSASAQGVEAGEITLHEGETNVPGLVFRARRRRRPVVLVAHGNPGFDRDYVEFCGRVAAQDINVVALDWTVGAPPYPELEIERASWLRSTVGSATFWERGARRYSLALQWLERERIGYTQLFGFGICGGGVVFGNWMAMAPPLRGVVLFHAAARMRVERDPSTPMRDLIDMAPLANCPIQGHYGLLDQVARVADARDYERRLSEAGRVADFFYYPDAGHGFVLTGAAFDASSGFGYVPFAAEQAIQRALKFVSGG